MKLFYRELGKSTKNQVIILHGLWGASENWLTIAKKIRNNYHIIIPDIRNHGRSPHSPEMNYNIMAEDVAILISSLRNKSEKIDVIGHSMGGKIALKLKLLYPEIINKCIIIDIAPVTYALNDMHMTLSNFCCLSLDNITNRQELKEFINTKFKDEKEIQLILKNISHINGKFLWKIDGQSILNNLNNIRSWEDSFPTKDTTYIKGENSDYVSKQIIKKLYLTNVITIPNAGHIIHIDNPSILTRYINSILSNNNHS